MKDESPPDAAASGKVASGVLNCHLTRNADVFADA